LEYTFQKKGKLYKINFLQKISQKQLKELQDGIYKENDTIAIRRAQAILMLEEGVPADLIKLITHYQREVVVKHRRMFLKHGFDILRSKRKEKAPKQLLTGTQKDQIVEVLNTQKPTDYGIDSQFWTAAILGSLIEEQYGVKYKSKTSLYLIFKRAKFTFHKPEKQSEKRSEKLISEWKKKYKSIIEEECSRNDTVVLVGDEAALTSETRLQKVWLPVDKPAFIEDTAKRKRVHLYGFLNIQNGVAIAFKTKSQCGEVTVTILKKLAELHPKKRIVIFWDNASWHKSQTVREYLKTTKSFKLYNFPPYAPDLNPQEHVWKEVREKTLNNKLIRNIDDAAKSAVDFINNSLFKYKFFGAHGTFNV